MKWIKKGLIFCPNSNTSWMHTHAALPVADQMENDIHRIYFSTRDTQNRASPGYIDINITNPKEILEISKNPVLPLGDLGSFDENGIMPTSIVKTSSKKYMYYVGWNLGVTVPFRWSIGLAISTDSGKTFCKYSEGPIIDRNPIDPYLIASPTVIIDDGLWRMWYISSSKWRLENGKPVAPYHINYSESRDGINWNRQGIVAIALKENESGIGRTSVLKENGLYRMWYSFSVDKYRMGYAESKDGIKWQRKDNEVGIDVSETGWDYESIEYPYVFNHHGIKYMLYNGNNYGKTGFGYAVLDEIS